MWRRVNMLSAAGITTLLALTAAAQDQPPPAPLLDPTHAQQAQLMIETWLADGQTPSADDATPVMVRGLVAVRVTLRSDGITVGQGQAIRDDPQAADEPTDLTALLSRAAASAFESLRGSLRDQEMRAAIEGRSIMAPTQPTISDVAFRIQSAVQLAHTLESIRVPPNAPPNRVYNTFAPGFHGLRLTDPPTGRSAWMWPATALARNIAPASQLVQLTNQLDRPVDEARIIGRPDGLALERFEVYHVAPPAPGVQPLLLVRGQVPIPPRTISQQTLNKMTEALSDHLVQRFTHDGVLRGTYHPTSGRYDPLVASPDEALLTAYALTRHVRHQRLARPDAPHLAEANRLAQELAVRLARAMENGELETTPARAAMVLLTVVANALPPRHTDVRDRMTELLLEMTGDDGVVRSAADPDAEAANQTVAALVTAALAATYEQTRRENLTDPLRALLDRAWAQAEDSPNVNALPWLITAHQSAAALPADTDEHRQQKQRHDRLAGDMVQLLLRRQVIDPPKLGPSDVVGGFVLHDQPPDSPPNPDWTTAQLLSFIAGALRQPSIRAERDELGWVLSAGLAARFLRQLQFHPSGAYYVRNPSETIGGIRLALWDNELPLRSSAMTLLGITDLQEALDALKPAEPPGPGE